MSGEEHVADPRAARERSMLEEEYGSGTEPGAGVETGGAEAMSVNADAPEEEHTISSERNLPEDSHSHSTPVAEVYVYTPST